MLKKCYNEYVKGNGEIMKIVPRNYYFDDLFDNFFSGEESKMKCDIYEKEGNYVLEMDIPGYKKEDIKIECNKGNIVIIAEKENKMEEHDDKKYLRRERIYGKYQRSFYLGDILEENISATFQDGTLKVIVPKMEEKDTRKYIEVK